MFYEKVNGWVFFYIISIGSGIEFYNIEDIVLYWVVVIDYMWIVILSV